MSQKHVNIAKQFLNYAQPHANVPQPDGLAR